MKVLIKKIKEIENILYSLEITLKEEYKTSLNPNDSDVDISKFITKKKILFKKFFILNQERIFFEKKYNTFAPYKNNYELENCWNSIVNKCCVLKKLNLKNKKLINKKFYLNQRFLELFSTHEKYITYNSCGILKNLKN